MNRRQFLSTAAAGPAVLAQPRRRNLIFILTDDHRYNFFGAMGHPWLKGHTPNLDRLLTGGVHFRNAFVTSSLCSPSRASILTGLYAHKHGVLDNFSAFPDSLVTFPRILQQNGYRTGFVGKWHMGGESDERRPGFDHWVSFRGQGEYIDPAINFNGDRRKTRGYMTDILTGEARRFVRENASRPFLLYLSHKAVHFPFQPPARHAGLFAGLEAPRPESMKYREEYYAQLPAWVKARRYSRHGVDGMFGQTQGFDEAYRGYCRCLRSVDESTGELLAELEQRGLLNDTLIVYMGDNGYMWGEHGLVDKRAMYEPSMRVPVIAHCPDLFGRGRSPEGLALNVDIAPTMLDAAGVSAPPMHGRSLIPLARGEARDWRTDFLYEYEWEQDYPATPTITGLRTEQWSLMQHWGVWDMSELYDIRKDSEQMRNLIADSRVTLERGRWSANIKDPELRKRIESLQDRMKQILTETGGDPRRAGRWSEADRYAL